MDRIRQWFAEPRYSHDLDLARRFWQGQGRYAISLQTNVAYYRQCFDDQKMILSAAEQLAVQATLPGLSYPTFYPDYGTVTPGRYFGCQPVKPEHGPIYAPPVVQTIDEALALEPLPIDHPEGDAVRAVNAWRKACETLQTDRLWFRIPEMQGPFNVAGLVMNQEELFMAIFTEPEKVRQFLDRMTDFVIDYVRYFLREVPDRICGGIWPYNFVPTDIGFTLTEDLMPLLSAQVYREFGIPCLRRFQEALGPLHIHCCGQYAHQVENLRAAGLKLLAMEYHHPATSIEELAPLAGQTVFIPFVIGHQAPEWPHPTDYYRHLLRTTPKHYRYWFACPDDDPQYRSFAEEFGPVGD
jgi:hypothetical protein